MVLRLFQALADTFHFAAVANLSLSEELHERMKPQGSEAMHVLRTAPHNKYFRKQCTFGLKQCPFGSRVDRVHDDQLAHETPSL